MDGADLGHAGQDHSQVETITSVAKIDMAYITKGRQEGLPGKTVILSEAKDLYWFVTNEPEFRSWNWRCQANTLNLNCLLGNLENGAAVAIFAEAIPHPSRTG